MAATYTPENNPGGGQKPPISFYEACVREEAKYQRAHGNLEAWCASLRLDPALFDAERAVETA